MLRLLSIFKVYNQKFSNFVDTDNIMTTMTHGRSVRGNRCVIHKNYKLFHTYADEPVTSRIR